MPAPRSVVVDDTSVDIKYSGGPWFPDVGSHDAEGNFGPAYLSTLHGTNASASLTFSFTGTTIIARGLSHIRNDSGAIDPQWSCYVDGVGIPNSAPARAGSSAQNTWQLCGADTTDAPHTIVVNITVARSQTFWFDRMDYVPSPSASLANKTVLLTASYPAFQFGTGWTRDSGSSAAWTQTQGSLFIFTFYGTSLSWYGHIIGDWNGNSTTATWAIDDKPATTFLLKGHTSLDSPTAYNQIFFETEVYPFGPHTLKVIHNGDSSKTALYLAYLVVQNDTMGSVSTSPSQTATLVANSTTPATPSQTANSRDSAKTPAIVGGAIGGIVCLIVVLLVLYRRLRQQKSVRETGLVVAEYIPPQVPHDSPSRLPVKMTEEVSGGSNRLSFAQHPVPTGPSSAMNTSDSVLHFPSVTDSTGQVAGPSNLVGHHEGAALLDNPPAYTQG